MLVNTDTLFVNNERIVFYVYTNKWCMQKTGKLNKRTSLPNCFLETVFKFLFGTANENYRERMTALKDMRYLRKNKLLQEDLFFF